MCGRDNALKRVPFEKTTKNKTHLRLEAKGKSLTGTNLDDPLTVAGNSVLCKIRRNEP